MESDNNINSFGGTEASFRGERADRILEVISTLLANLLQKDEVSSIDLDQQKLDQWDYERLQQVLGWGDVVAELGEPVATRILSTAIAGVWWVSHLNDDGEVIAEFIEIGYCPEVMIVAVEEVEEGREVLRARQLAVRFEK